MSHLSEDEVERFLAARLGPAEQKRVIRHLLAGCGVCSRKLVEQAPERLLEQAGGQDRKAAQDSPRERTLAAALEQDARWRLDEKKLARSLELLRGSPGGYDSLTSRQVRSLHGVPLVEALLERSFELRYSDPKAMRWLAYNAVQAAESLRPAEHDRSPLSEIQARAWGELGNSYRANDEFAEAEGAFGRARSSLRRSGGNLRLMAHLAGLEASLRKEQRRLAEACELLDGVYRINLQLGNRHLAGRALISNSGNLRLDGRPLQAIEHARKGLSLIQPDTDPLLLQIGQQGLIDSFVDAGQYQEAGRLLLRSGLRQSFVDVPVGLLSLRWTEGKLLAGLGKSSSAETALTRTRAEFEGMGSNYTAALVDLDLIPVLLQQGKFREVRETARKAYGTLRSFGIHQEAAKARSYLQ